MDVGHAIYALEGSDGLILSGGEDVDPSHYGAERSPHLKEVDPRRDALELALFAAAKERHLPILAICRGLQLVNVALGGTLWQDLPSECESQLNHDVGDRWDIRSHSITLGPDTQLHDTLRCETLVVKRRHHRSGGTLRQRVVTRRAVAPRELLERVGRAGRGSLSRAGRARVEAVREARA
jgi:putative glutamine amidotransferase